MPVAIDLQPARQPSGNADAAQSQILVDEIEIVVQALAFVWPQKSLASGLIVPGLVDRTWLHGRENTYQPRMLATLGQRLLHQIFLAYVSFSDELDFDPGLPRQPLGAVSQPFAERLGKLRVVEDPNLPFVEVGGHLRRVADLRQRAENQDAIPASQHPCNLILVPLGQ